MVRLRGEAACVEQEQMLLATGPQFDEEVLDGLSPSPCVRVIQLRILGTLFNELRPGMLPMGVAVN